MTIRELTCDAFDATVDGIAKRCSVDGNKQAAVAVASDVLDVTNQLVSAIADDGKIDAEEIANIKARFRNTIATRIPDESFWFLGTVWGIVKKWLKGLQEKISNR